MPVVIYIQPGSVSAERQWQMCVEHCRRHDYEWSVIVPAAGAADAIELVVSGAAEFIVTAFSARPRPGDIRFLAAERDVRIEYVRPPVVRREVADLVVRVYRNSGRDLHRTARILGYDIGSIRAALVRMGIRIGNGTTPDSRE